MSKRVNGRWMAMALALLGVVSTACVEESEVELRDLEIQLSEGAGSLGDSGAGESGVGESGVGVSGSGDSGPTCEPVEAAPAVAAEGDVGLILEEHEIQIVEAPTDDLVLEGDQAAPPAGWAAACSAACAARGCGGYDPAFPICKCYLAAGWKWCWDPFCNAAALAAGGLTCTAATCP